MSIQKLELDFAHMPEAIELAGFEMLPLKQTHLTQLLKLPWHHRDPFDRSLIAQAISERLLIQTADSQVQRYFTKT